MTQKRIYTQKMATNTPSVGNLLANYIEKNRIYKSSLARKMNRSDSTILQFTKQQSVQSSILWEISHALKHNFFADLAAQLPADYTTDAPQDTIKDETIAQLKRRIEILEAQVEVLRR